VAVGEIRRCLQIACKGIKTNTNKKACYLLSSRLFFSRKGFDWLLLDGPIGSCRNQSHMADRRSGVLSACFEEDVRPRCSTSTPDIAAGACHDPEHHLGNAMQTDIEMPVEDTSPAMTPPPN